MLIGELLRVAWKAVTAHKLRSFLTLLGVIIGVMTVVAVVAVITGLNNYVARGLPRGAQEKARQEARLRPGRAPRAPRGEDRRAVGNAAARQVCESSHFGRPDPGDDREPE